MCITALPLQWRETAELLRNYGATEAATAAERCAQELEEQLDSTGDELLTPKEAAACSGYTPEQLRRLMARGELHNFGGKHARYRRSELPVKAGSLLRSVPDHANVPLARKQIARAVINGH